MQIYLYPLELPYLDIDSIKQYVKDITYKELISRELPLNKVVEKVASTRIIDHKRPFIEHKVSEEDVAIEHKLSVKPLIMDRLYDGYRFQLVLNELINDYAIHIILSNRYLCTFDDNDYRYHLRSVIFGHPDIISIPGIVEAPAKPKEYYIMVYKSMRELDLKELFKDRIMDYDHRINEVIKGLVLQIIKYHIIGYPFCSDNRCKLYNAHWQEELINSQLYGYVCDNDKEILKTDL